jgi:hypothetical protein
MSELFNLQDEFQHYLLQGDNDFSKHIISTEKISIETRLNIYRNAYRARLVEALTSNYPILYAYLGHENFERIVNDYINQFPSHYRSIRWFGDQLSHFLTEHPETKALPYLAELAQFEWIQTLVFDAADHPILQIETVAHIPPESWMNMRFIPHPSVHRINFTWNIVQIWQAFSDQQKVDEPVKHSAPIPWILWRRDLINRFYSLTTEESWAIDAVLQHLTFGELCEGLCQWFNEEDAGIQAASLLKGWIQSGLLADVTFLE